MLSAYGGPVGRLGYGRAMRGLGYGASRLGDGALARAWRDDSLTPIGTAPTRDVGGE